jgi:hypothetical protein
MSGPSLDRESPYDEIPQFTTATSNPTVSPVAMAKAGSDTPPVLTGDGS